MYIRVFCDSTIAPIKYVNHVMRSENSTLYTLYGMPKPPKPSQHLLVAGSLLGQFSKGGSLKANVCSGSIIELDVEPALRQVSHDMSTTGHGVCM